MAKTVYRIVRKGAGFNQYGPTPDRVLSQHRTTEAAQRAFDRIVGHAVLLAPDGPVLNHRIA